MARERIERLWVIGGTVLAVLVAAIAWLVVVHPELSKASSLRSATNSARSENSTLQAKIDKLERDRSRIGSLRRSLAAAQAALPSDSGLDAFTRQVSAQATAAHVTVTGITAGLPTPVGGASASSAAPADGASPAEGAATASSPSPSSPPSPSSTAPASAASTSGAAGGVYSIPVTVVVNGSSAHDLAFLHALQRSGPRAVLVNATQMSGQSGSGVTLNVQLELFAAPGTAPPTPAP